MSFELQDVVPWGRSFGEYLRMFALTEADLGRRILGAGDGPASFNAVASRHGCRAVSADPLYRFTAGQIAGRIGETAPVVAEQLRRNASDFVWTHFESVEELVEARLEAMNEFLGDYPSGREAGRYVDAALPELPFRDDSFDLALCSHLLFLYSEQHDADYHVAALAELARVAAEVRVFPLLELAAVPSRHLERVTALLRDSGYDVERVPVEYEFQKGANEMLRVRRR
ncbi:MAG: SAM-dependent methyltransferase [Gammaproteobacteria bacterium]|nr:SAM-dependent methyltransferase [Gammaproteobacteria bacterium]